MEINFLIKKNVKMGLSINRKIKILFKISSNRGTVALSINQGFRHCRTPG